MPQLTVNGTTGEVEEGTRLVLAIEQQGVHIGHRCGGNARCTTCRVTFEDGEPSTMTVAEYNKLKDRDLLGQFRLSCQITCTHDMTVTAAMTLETEEGWTDTGPEPAPTVVPEAKWYPRDELERGEHTIQT
jgi:ferredoxin